MSRESAHVKGRRYAIEGRLQVRRVTADAIEATCRGDGHVYALGWHGEWHCDCPARSDRCAHLVALRLVTVANAGPQIVRAAT